MTEKLLFFLNRSFFSYICFLSVDVALQAVKRHKYLAYHLWWLKKAILNETVFLCLLVLVYPFQSFNLITKYTALENVILSMDVAAMCDERYELVKLGSTKACGSCFYFVIP